MVTITGLINCDPVTTTIHPAELTPSKPLFADPGYAARIFQSYIRPIPDTKTNLRIELPERETSLLIHFIDLGPGRGRLD